MPSKAIRLWALGAASVVGFDIEAHDAIGQTASSAMDQAAVKQVKRLLGGKDVSDVAGWGHQVDDTFPGMARLHFQVHDDRGSQPFCGPVEERIAHCEDGVCLLSAIKHFYGKILADEGRRIDYPKLDYNKAAKGISFSDADAVKMLINLIGDMHQPMQVGYASDDNGHGIQVRFNGNTYSLYDFWGQTISEAIRERQNNWWYGGWTHIGYIRSEWEQDKKVWKEEGPMKTFDKWMAEQVKFACEKAYVHPITGKKLGGPDAQPGPVDIDETAYHAWKELWLKQILLAGERLAIVLNDILDAGGAARLSSDAKVQTKKDKEEKKEMEKIAQERKEWKKAHPEHAHQRLSVVQPTHFRIVPSVFFLNVAIACVTVPLFLAFVNYGLNPQVWVDILRNYLEPPKPAGGDSGAPPRSSKRVE